MALEVQQLRELRDNQLLNTESGSIFMTGFNQIYYSFSPTIADMEREHPMFKEAVKLAITPMISTLCVLEKIRVFFYKNTRVFLSNVGTFDKYTFLQINHAKNPDIFIPRIVAIPVLLPIIAN